MDPYGDPDWPPADESARNAMGHTLMYAKKINLVRMKPHGELASSGYALANPAYEYASSIRPVGLTDFCVGLVGLINPSYRSHYTGFRTGSD